MKDKKNKDNGVSVLIVTNRESMFENLISNYSRQNYKYKELIIIINDLSINTKKYEELRNESIQVFLLHQNITLGECLNFGILLSKYDVIAKFDDDDYYAENYLTNSIHALISNDADLVCKEKYYIYLKNSSTLLLTHGSSLRYMNKLSSFIKGSTLVFKKNIQKFISINLGEDVLFIKDLFHNNKVIFLNDEFDHITIRDQNLNHTWKNSDEYYLSRSRIVNSEISLDDAINIISKKNME